VRHPTISRTSLSTRRAPRNWRKSPLRLKYTTDTTLTPPVKVTESKLTVDLDLWIYRDNVLVAHSSTFDSSFEIVEFEAVAGATYEILIKRFSGTDLRRVRHRVDRPADPGRASQAVSRAPGTRSSRVPPLSVIAPRNALGRLPGR